MRIAVPFAIALLWLNFVTAIAGASGALLCAFSILGTVGAAVWDDQHKPTTKDQGDKR